MPSEYDDEAVHSLHGTIAAPQDEVRQLRGRIATLDDRVERAMHVLDQNIPNCRAIAHRILSGFENTGELQ